MALPGGGIFVFGPCDAMRDGRDNAPLEGPESIPNRAGNRGAMNEAR